jgi:hypothetical protein
MMMMMMPSLKLCNILCLNRIRTAHIRKEVQMEDIQNQIKGNRLRWFKYVKRTDEHGIPKRLLEMKMKEDSPAGRWKKRRDGQRQADTPLQKSTHWSGNDGRRR